MDLIELDKPVEQPVDGTTLTKYINQLLSIAQGRASYKDTDPEVMIFYKKQVLSKRLLEISVEDLSTAPKQSWYGEYIALLAIRIENTALRFIGKKYVEELMKWYNAHVKSDERELAVLGIIQFISPLELTVPFNQNLWHEKMRTDVRLLFTNFFPSTNYADDEITTYYLSRQAKWRYNPRKIRVVFMVQSHVTCDKILPVYELMKKRDDILPFLVFHTNADYKYSDNSWSYFHSKYPNDVIYGNCTLMDLRKLRPDYVFITNPYENRRSFPSFRVEDIVTFAKLCVISYGATLAYCFARRLFDDYPKFYRNVYLFFCSGQSIKTVMAEKMPRNINLNLQHVEFLGYPVLKTYYKLETEPSSLKRILWTPRWTPDENREARMGGSHFLDYKDNFISLRERYKDNVELYFRPHMNLFKELIKRGTMSKNEVIAYKKSLKQARIIRQDTLIEMYKSIRNIDIFIADYSSIVIELFLTGRPVIYCEFPNAVPLPEYKEMFEAMYIAHSWQEVERYLDDLMADKDPLFEKRRAVAKKIYETHKDATEKIVERIVQDFKAGQSSGN